MEMRLSAAFHQKHGFISRHLCMACLWEGMAGQAHNAEFPRFLYRKCMLHGAAVFLGILANEICMDGDQGQEVLQEQQWMLETAKGFTAR